MANQFSITNLIFFKRGNSHKRESRKAKIFDEESPVCTLENRSNCYDPDSLKKSFHPLGIFSKCFGLFPCYDFAFVDELSDNDVNVVHILDYCYSALIFCLLTGGAIICHIIKPMIISSAGVNESEKMDTYVKLALIYSTILAGVQSLFVFPMKWNEVLNFVKLFSNIDKILRFDGRMEERWFGKKVLFYLVGCFLFTIVSFMFLFVYGLTPGNHPCVTDYLMGPIMALALMTLITPSGLAVFFLNAIKLRMLHFNQKMNTLLSPLTPSTYTCTGYQDYGKELDELSIQKKSDQLVEDLEKMRILYCELLQLGKCTCGIFGNHLVRDFLYSIVALIFYTYFLINIGHESEWDYNWIIYAGQNAFILMKILVIVCFGQNIICQGTLLRSYLRRVSLRRLSDACSLQMQAFLGTVDTPPAISAAGFFTLDKAMMTSILGAITTYFIILMQFKMNGVYKKREN